MRNRWKLLLATTTLTAALALCAAAPAGAHGDEGEMTVTKLEQTGPTTVEIQVGIVYEGDEHLAEDATVTAVLSGPDGASVGPVQLTRTGDTTSLYGATVEVPTGGDWSVTVDSEEPTATATQSVSVSESSTTTTSAAPTTDGGSTTVAPAEVTTTREQVSTEEDADDEGLSPALIVGACLVLAGIVIGGAVLVARSRSRRDAEE